MVKKIYLVIKKIFQYVIFYPTRVNTTLEFKGKVAVMNSIFIVTLVSFIPFIIQTYLLGNHSRIFQTGSIALGVLLLFTSLNLNPYNNSSIKKQPLKL